MPESNQTPPQEKTAKSQEQHYLEEENDEISLRDIFLAIWPYRWVIGVLTCLLVIFTVSVAGLLYFSQPVTHVVEQKFKLTFQGVQDNEYPNGAKFSAEDILTNPVLNKVYERNNLSEYMDFSEFQNAVAVYQRNDQIKFLEKEYNAKLNNSDLSAAEREKIEQEFQARKENAMAPIFILTYQGENSEASSIPKEVIGKTLKDILKTWAQYAKRVRGVTQYDLTLISKNILDQQEIEEENLMVANDMLRVNAERVKEQLNDLQELPGAHTIQTGEESVTLQDLSVRLEDAQRFQLEPLTGLIRQSGITKNPRNAQIYLENRLFDLRLEQEELSEKAKLYENSLKQYKEVGSEVSVPASAGADGTGSSLPSRARDSDVTTIPQFGSSFLNSIMDLATKSADTKFRQKILTKATEAGEQKIETTYDMKYYEELKDKVQEKASASKQDEKTEMNDGKYALKRVDKVHTQVFQQLMHTIEKMHMIYDKLSKHNLNPESRMYNMKEPLIVKDTQQFSIKEAGMFSILALILGEGLIFVLIFIVHGFRSSLRGPRKE